jgi:hypothetical protein
MNPETERIRKRLTPAQLVLFDWMREAAGKNPGNATLLLGAIAAEAAAHPERNFWRLLEAVKPMVRFGVIS